MLAVPLSALPGARLRLLSRAEMAGVERVPPEGILSLPNAAAPQLLAALLNQRRRHKVKRKIGALGKNSSSRLDACERKKGGGVRGSKGGVFDEGQHWSHLQINTNVISHQQAH